MNKEPVSKGKYPREIKGLLLLLLSVVFLISILSFQRHHPHSNWLGLVGWGIGFALNYLLGITSYLATAFVGWIGWRLLLKGEIQPLAKILYFSVFLLSFGILCNLSADHFPFLASWMQEHIYTESYLFDFPYPHEENRYNLGGVPLYYIYKDVPVFNLQRLLSDFGVALTCCVTLIASFFLFTDLPIIDSLMKLKGLFFKPAKEPMQSIEQIEETLTKHTLKPLYSPKTLPTPQPKKIAEPKKIPFSDSLPPLSLLNQPQKVDQPSLKKELKKQADILEETLGSFGIEAKVGDIHCGPTIASFEVHPAVGVKVQKIKTLENDIALNLQAKSIRIIAPIPGKAAVGVEIPSLYPQSVSFKELLIDYQNGSKKMGIPLLLGKTVAGENVIADLTKMPHCLIAGATGSGKSVCINTIIMSILMNAKPDEIKLIMIDPKKVELTPYTNLPHMIAPVITEPHGAYAALNWLVKEMQNRYELLKQLGLRNITAFNQRTPNKEVEASLSLPVPDKLPFMVAIIDEFADLMMASSSDLETPIARIAQMARAVGIHLLLATQRPSREVITGLIKANFPTRIAFKVANRVNSQIILDDIGAESLLGNGDMLFLPPGTSSLIRAQGVYMSDEEIQKVIAFICNQTPTHYLIESFDSMRFESTATAEEGSKDSLYDEARELVLSTRTASTTFLQRKLKIGYARAASLMDELESRGVIGPQEGAKPRRILGDVYEEKDLME
ncbi:MAG: translocase ftsK [Chlamydiota bacterium]|jgi:S-DNA-T family DNA segregation ATPase FtsK/SpoIIIE